MEITTTTQTKINISHTEIQDIVTNYFKEKGYEINNYRPIIKTVYDGTMGDPGTEEFMGVEITANKGIVRSDETYKFLEENGVFIHYIPEHYGNGSNLNFSIEFTKQKTQTGWYNDNHEFGDVYETMNKSIQLAKWYLENPSYINLINSGYDNPEYIKYKDILKEYLSTITKW